MADYNPSLSPVATCSALLWYTPVLDIRCALSFLMAPKKVKQVVHNEYVCDCGTTLKNVTDASIKLHLNGAPHRDALARLAQADNAYEVRTYDCECGVWLTNVTQY